MKFKLIRQYNKSNINASRLQRNIDNLLKNGNEIRAKALMLRYNKRYA